MISFPGIGSGLDVNSIVSQLIELESQPVVRLQTRKSVNDIKISGYGQISSTLSELQSSIAGLKDASSLVQYQAKSSDTSVFTATASSGASEESHSIEVVGLAVAHRLNSQLFTGESEVIGEGELTLTSGGNSSTITIDSDNSTLAGIRDAINDISGGTGISASIVNVDGGSRLILNAAQTGLANSIAVSVSGDSAGTDTDTLGLSRLVYDAGVTENLTQLQAAEDALVRIDGFDVTGTSNVISDAITGVTLTLAAEGNAELEVTKNYAAIGNALEDLVTAYNDLSSTISGLSGTSLSGDNLLLSLERQLRDVFATRLSGLGDIQSVFDIGLSFDREGVLSFDSGKLNTALENGVDAVVTLFADSNNGFAVALDSLIEGYLGSGGQIKSRTDGLTSRNDDLDKRIEVLTGRIESTEERLLEEFSALDGLVSQLTSTGDFVARQLDQLLANTQTNR